MPAGKLFGKYDVLRRIAAGGMGEIYLGRQRGVAGFERLVIIKTLLPQLTEDADSVASFLDEARILGCINHPNVVALFEVGEQDGEYAMVMEHVHGVDLSLLRRTGAKIGKPVPPFVAAGLVMQAALGLDAVHRAKDPRGEPLKVVHRDVSPQNLMVRADGNLKLLDFGVAHAEQKQAKTVHGQLKGKLGYMSPEQVRTMPLDGRHDQWSLGVLFWELLTGKRLFRAEDMVTVMKMIIGERIPSPSEINSNAAFLFDDIVLRMLERERDERYPTLADAADAIRRVLEAHHVPAHEVQRYVEDVVGTQLEEQLKALLSDAPQPSEKAPAAQKKTCERCHFVQPAMNRFCASCGASLEISESVSVPSGAVPRPPTAVPKPVFPVDPPEGGGAGRGFADLPPDEVTGRRIASWSEPSAEGVLPLQPPPNTQSALAAATSPRPVVTSSVVLVRVLPPALAPSCGAALAALAERHGATAAPTDAGEMAALFTQRGADRSGDRALAFALDVGAAIAAAQPQAQARVVVAHGDARAEQGRIRGAALELAQRVLADSEPGVIVDASARAVLSRNLRNGRLLSMDASIDANAPIEVVGGPRARPTPGVVGRDTIVAQLAEVVGEAQRGRGAVVALSGGAGVGRSALLNEVAPLCAWKGMVAARASCSLKAAAPPFDVVRQLIRSVLVELAAEAQFPTPGVVGLAVGLEASSLAPGDAARILALFAPAPHAEPTPLAQRAAALRASVSRLFLSVARSRGLVLLIDDAELMDATSRAFLDALLPTLDGERAAVFVAFNPRGSARAFAGARALRVPPLEDHAIAALVESAAGPMAEGVLEHVRAQAGGNPRAALAAVGLLAAEQAIVQVGQLWELAPHGRKPKLVNGVGPLVDTVLKKLTTRSLVVLQGVAMAGGAVPDDPHVHAAYDEAALLGLVQPRANNRPAPLSPTLQHALTHSAQALGGAKLAEIHALAASRAAARAAQDPGAPDTVAWHKRFAEPSTVPVAEYVAALSRHGALGVIEPLVETGAQLCAALARGAVRIQPDALGEATLNVAAVSLEALTIADASAALQLLDALIPSVPAQMRTAALARIARVRVHALARAGRLAEVEAALATASALAAQAHAAPVAAAVAVDRGRFLEARGDLHGARAAYEEAAAIPFDHGVGDEGAAWSGAIGLATVCAALDDVPDAMIAAERALERAHGRPHGECAVELAVSRFVPQAIARAQGAVTAADRAADVAIQVLSRQNLADVLVKAHKTSEARKALGDALALARDGLYSAGVDALRPALAAFA